MKHVHDANLVVSVDVPTQDLGEVIDKITDSAVKIIVVFTLAQVIKAALDR